MNKKVLTLCAGLLLGGSAFVNAEDIKLEETYKGEAAAAVTSGTTYFFAMEYGDSSYAYGIFKNANGKIGEDVNKMDLEKIDEKDLNNYLWTVEEHAYEMTSGSASKWVYALKNKATNKYLGFAADGTITFSDAFDITKPETYIVLSNYAKFSAGSALVTGNWNSTTNYYLQLNDSGDDLVLTSTASYQFNFYKVTDKKVSDTDLNELYNTTGFNLVLNQDKWKDVENIFKSSRIRAIEVKDAKSGEYSFPAGIYFVTKVSHPI